MKEKYYKLFVDCYNKKSTCLFPNPPIEGELCEDGKNISAKYLEGIRIDFPSGDDEANFLPMHSCLRINSGIVSQQFRDVVEPYITDPTAVEFVPVKVVHEKYGERTYYIMHFLRFEDAIDEANSKIMTYPDGTRTIMVPSLKRSFIKTKHLFCVDAVGSTIVSDTLKKALLKNGMKEGLSFSKSCISEDK